MVSPRGDSTQSTSDAIRYTGKCGRLRWQAHGGWALMPKTLLLADDSVTIQKVVGITFANEDVELVTVDNGDDALVRARQVKPDLVLADIGMPGLTGYDMSVS